MPSSLSRLWGIKGKETPHGFEDNLIAHLDALYTAALRLTKDRQQAEDLVQEASLRAWRKRDQLESQHAIKGWLFKILLNTFINRYRQAEREPRFVDVELTEEMLEHAHASPGPRPENPQDALLNQCLDEEIQQAFDQLHMEMRAVLWLSDVEGFRLREVAEMLGCPPGTVASRLFRGRALLRELLHSYAERRGLIKE